MIMEVEKVTEKDIHVWKTWMFSSPELNQNTDANPPLHRRNLNVIFVPMLEQLQNGCCI